MNDFVSCANLSLLFGYMLWEVGVFTIIVGVSASLSHLVILGPSSLFSELPSSRQLNVFATELTCCLIYFFTFFGRNSSTHLTPKCFISKGQNLWGSSLQSFGYYIACILVFLSLLVQTVAFQLQLSSSISWLRDFAFLFSLYTSAYFLARLFLYYHELDWTQTISQLGAWSDLSWKELLKLNLACWTYELLVCGLVMFQMMGLGSLGVLFSTDGSSEEYAFLLLHLAGAMLGVVQVFMVAFVEERLLNNFTGKINRHFRVCRWRTRWWLCYILLQFVAVTYYMDIEKCGMSPKAGLLNNIFHFGLIGFLWMTVIKDALLRIRNETFSLPEPLPVSKICQPVSVTRQEDQECIESKLETVAVPLGLSVVDEA